MGRNAVLTQAVILTSQGPFRGPWVGTLSQSCINPGGDSDGTKWKKMKLNPSAVAILY